MGRFKFAIMGAGKIAHKFCDAVNKAGGEVCAVSSKSAERAEAFAKEEHIEKYYGSYEAMLKENEIDCVYIATTADSHYESAMLCMDYKTPLLCEKAMFLNGKQARTLFGRSKTLGVFAMEAMWSRFLPSLQTAKKWLDSGKIGKLCLIDIQIGFYAERNPENRFFSPLLGGGTSYDLTVYSYELTRFFEREPICAADIQVIRGGTGVDVTTGILLKYPDYLAVLKTTFMGDLDDHITLYGEDGKIVIPNAQSSKQAVLYSRGGDIIEEYTDDTQNGFVFEVSEVMRCIENGEIESPTVPHSLTLDCAELFDEIMKK